VRLLPQIERPDIVEAQDVICVPVRENYSIEPLQILPKRLRSKVGAGVNDYGLAGANQQDRRPRALVVHIL